jgi:hypothetical protein
MRSLPRLHNENIKRLVVSQSVSGDFPCGGGVEYLHRRHASYRRRRKGRPSAWKYNLATLFLGDINTGTWPSRLRESRI